jgi:hypothetical protein
MNDAAKPSEKGLHKYRYYIGVRKGDGYFGRSAAVVIAAANAEDAVFMIKQRWKPSRERPHFDVASYYLSSEQVEAVGDDTPVSAPDTWAELFDDETRNMIQWNWRELEKMRAS